MKNRYFPIVISRDDRAEYIDALEQADAGNLKHLINLFVRLEKDTILQILDEGKSESEPQGDLVDHVVGAIVDRAKQRALTESEQMRSVNHIAAALQESVETYLNKKSQEIENKFASASIYLELNVSSDDTKSGGQYRLRSRIDEIGRRVPYPINLNESGCSVVLLMSPIAGLDYPILLFTLSLHHTGRELTGIMAATAFAEIGHYSEYIDKGQPHTLRHFGMLTFHNCAPEPFTFTWNDSADEVRPRFINWTEACLSIALRYWMDNS